MTHKERQTIQEAIVDIECTGFLACPGSDGNRIYSMQTCHNCASVIKLRRLLKADEQPQRHG